MKKEFLFPLMYTVKRDMLRHRHSWSTGIIAFASAMLRDYLWIPIYVFYILGGPTLFQLFGIVLHLIAFSITYEMGYIYTDCISVKKEKKSIRRVVYAKPIPDKQIYTSLCIRLLVLAVLLYLMQPWLSIKLLLLYFSVIVIYLLYGNLKEKYRVPLFLVLRYLKGFIPYSFLIVALDQQNFLLVSIVLLGTAIFNTIEYGSRKLELTYINVQKIKFLWLRYLIIIILLASYFSLNEISYKESVLLLIIYGTCHLFMIFMSLLRNFPLRKRIFTSRIFSRSI